MIFVEAENAGICLRCVPLQDLAVQRVIDGRDTRYDASRRALGDREADALVNFSDDDGTVCGSVVGDGAAKAVDECLGVWRRSSEAVEDAWKKLHVAELQQRVAKIRLPVLGVFVLSLVGSRRCSRPDPALLEGGRAGKVRDGHVCHKWRVASCAGQTNSEIRADVAVLVQDGLSIGHCVRAVSLTREDVHNLVVHESLVAAVHAREKMVAHDVRRLIAAEAAPEELRGRGGEMRREHSLSWNRNGRR